jgi:L,D-peptidoglycan transpeptidase YkuD (ErfK/YbiS/YcfS/YnhG family)
VLVAVVRWQGLDAGERSGDLQTPVAAMITHCLFGGASAFAAHDPAPALCNPALFKVLPTGPRFPSVM